jgi:nickel-dependent lactate racemase
MRLSIPYGKSGGQDLQIADDNLVGLFGPNPLPEVDSRQVLRQALARPLGAESLEDFIALRRNLMVLVNDSTRPTPTSLVLEEIAPHLDREGISFLVATGIHRAPTEEELRHIFGRFLDKFRGRIFVHDARRDEMLHLGTSRNGTEMIVNRRVAEADGLLIVSSVEPHYFAGYTGGRKSLLPGVAAYKTIEQNHRLALRAEAQALRLQGNPVHEDMVDAVSCVAKPMFAIQTVLDSKHRIHCATAGDIDLSLQEAARLADRIFCVPVPQAADIVVSVVKFPADIDLYQAQKGIDNGKLALQPGGVLILVAECRDGIGERAFFDLLSSAAEPQAVFEKIAAGYKLGYHKAAKLAEVLLQGQIFAVTSIEPQLLEKIFIKPFPTVQAALDEALGMKGKNASVLVLLDGSLCVPRLEGNTC